MPAWIKFLNHVHVFYPQQWEPCPKAGGIHRMSLWQDLGNPGNSGAFSSQLARICSAWKSFLGKTSGSLLVAMQESLALLGNSFLDNYSPQCKGREILHLLGGPTSLPILLCLCRPALTRAAGRGKPGMIPDLFS